MNNCSDNNDNYDGNNHYFDYGNSNNDNKKQ